MDENEKIAIKIRSMKKYVDFLRSYQLTPVKTLEEDYELKSAIERNFQLAIESALDIGEIVISAESFEKPEDHRSVILILGKHNIIPPDFAGRFARAVGLRNILVHMYEEVDMGKIHDYLQNNLVDFDEYVTHIARYLEMRNG
jgi:uncharacterized protein YutE (UPF0331/DUF86 family)